MQQEAAAVGEEEHIQHLVPGGDVPPRRRGCGRGRRTAAAPRSSPAAACRAPPGPRPRGSRGSRRARAARAPGPGRSTGRCRRAWRACRRPGVAGELEDDAPVVSSRSRGRRGRPRTVFGGPGARGDGAELPRADGNATVIKFSNIGIHSKIMHHGGIWAAASRKAGRSNGDRRPPRGEERRQPHRHHARGRARADRPRPRGVRGEGRGAGSELGDDAYVAAGGDHHPRPRRGRAWPTWRSVRS